MHFDKPITSLSLSKFQRTVRLLRAAAAYQGLEPRGYPNFRPASAAVYKNGRH